MNRYVSVFLIFVIVCLPCCFLVAADTVEETATVVYQIGDVNSSYYAGWSNQSPVYYGNINSGNYTYPFSLAVPQINLSGLKTNVGTVKPTNVIVQVSDPLIKQKDTIVYVGMWNGYTQFYGSNDFVTYFEWVPSTPGYRLKVEPGTSLGYTKPDDISINTPSNFSPAVSRQASGASGGSSTGITTSTIATRTPLNAYTSYVTGAVLTGPQWAVANNSYNIIKTVINTDSEERNQIKITYDSADLATCTITNAVSNEYLHSAVFVPLVLVVNAHNYTAEMIDNLDTIVSNLADITANFDIPLSDIYNILVSADANIIAGFSNISSKLTILSGYFTHMNFGPSGPSVNDSSIRWIEWYMKNVLSDTNNIVLYLDEITNTLSQIQQTLEDRTDAADDNADSMEDLHQDEVNIYDDVNAAIGSIVISGYTFDTSTLSGISGTANDFARLWSSLGTWNIIYTFSMTLGIALMIIRHMPHRSQTKNSEKRSNKNGSAA